MYDRDHPIDKRNTHYDDEEFQQEEFDYWEGRDRDEKLLKELDFQLRYEETHKET